MVAFDTDETVNHTFYTLEVGSDSDSAQGAGPLETVYFAYDSAELGGEAKNILIENAKFLKANPDVRIRIEGHCDERGSTEYNYALGEARARAVEDFLTGALRVPAEAVETVSLGKESPLAVDGSEMSRGQNRRASFVITGK